MRTRKTDYDTDRAKEYCQRAGLVWDEAFFTYAQESMKQYNITQEQFDGMTTIYIDGIIYNFNRKRFTWWQRVQVALYFLGFGKNIGG